MLKHEEGWIDVTFTKVDFEGFVWPALSKTGARGIADLRTGLALLHKIEAHEDVRVEEVSDERIDEASARGEFLVSDLAVDGEITFRLSGPEAQYLSASLQNWAASGRITLPAARHARYLSDRLRPSNVSAPE